MKIVLVRPENKCRADLDILVDMHFIQNPAIEEVDYLDVPNQNSLLVICSDSLDKGEVHNLLKNHEYPVIMLSGRPQPELVHEFNIYRSTTSESGHALMHMIKEGFEAKAVIDKFLGQQVRVRPGVLEELIDVEIARTNESAGSIISKFEAFYNILRRDPSEVSARADRKISDLRIGLVNVDIDFQKRMRAYLQEKKIEVSVASTELPDLHSLSKWDLIITAQHFAKSTAWENYRTPVILLSDNIPPGEREIYVRDWGVHQVISPAEQEKLIREATKALLYKFELDRLLNEFREIAAILDRKERIDEEQFFVKKGDHGRNSEEKAVYQVRGPARQISRFEAAYLIAMEELEKIMQGNKSASQVRIFSLYTSLHRETQLLSFIRKSRKVLNSIREKGNKYWIEQSLDVIQEYPDAAAKLWVQYYAQNLDDPDIVLVKHRHNIIKFTLKGTDKRLIAKVSTAAEQRLLKKEKELLDRYNEINKEITERTGTAYVHLPSLITSYFPEGPKRISSRRQKSSDFLLFEAAEGEPAYAIVNSYHRLLDSAPPADQSMIEKELGEQEAIKKELEKLGTRIMREKSKIIAMAYKIQEEAPALVERIQGREPDEKRKYYVEKVSDTFIESNKWQREYPGFSGGLRTLLPEERVKELHAAVLENIDPILDIVVNTNPGVMTDRSLRNSLIGKEEGITYTIDFETLRDLPTVFDFASSLEMGLSSNEETSAISEALAVRGQVVYAPGSIITKTQHKLVLSAHFLEEELRTVGLPENRISRIMERLVPSFEQYEREYYACAALTDMIGFGVSVRNMLVNKENVPDHAVNAYRFFTNLPSNVAQLRQFYQDEEKLKKLDALAKAVSSAKDEIKEGLEKCLKK